jgi:hypothetical protein
VVDVLVRSISGDRESHVRFQIQALQGDRSAAIGEHAAWLEAEANEDPDDHIPYRQEAALFANIYWSNRRRYDAEVSSAAVSG